VIEMIEKIIEKQINIQKKNVKQQSENRLIEKKAQVSFETLLGFTIFLIFFMGVIAFTTSETNGLTIQQENLKKMNSCMQLSQAFYEAKNNQIKWIGNADYNFYIKNNSIYVDYNGNGIFDGVYCKTTDTNLTRQVTKGDINIQFDVTRFVLSP
jgi:hypothetical protein